MTRIRTLSSAVEMPVVSRWMPYGAFLIAELVKEIPQLQVDWNKQKKIAFVVWFFSAWERAREGADPAAPGVVVTKEFLRQRLALFVRNNVGLGLGPEALHGGKDFADLTDAKSKKGLLEKAGRDSYRLSALGLAQFNKYDGLLRELLARHPQRTKLVRVQ